MTKFNGFMRISKKLPKEAVPSSFGTLNCRKSIPKEAVPSSFEKPARRGLKTNALTNLMFNIHESISSLRFTKLFQ